MTLVLPLALLVVNRRRVERELAATAIEQTLILTQVVFLTLLLIASYAPNFISIAKFIALLPIMFLPYRFGWAGGVAAIVALNLIVLVAYLTGISFGNLIDNQAFLAFGGLSSLLLGAAISEQRSLLVTLTDTNEALRQSVFRLQGERRQSEQLAGRVVAIQEEERNALSRELHDGIGQQASALRVNLKVLGQRLGEEHRDVMSAMESITASMYSMADELVHRLRPRVLDDLGLKRALESPDIASQLLGSGIAYHLLFDVDETRFSDELAITVYRMVQEAVNNAAKHSAARNLWVEVVAGDDYLQLVVRDDGIGIDDSHTGTGMGLTTIRDRAISVGGGYSLDSDHTGTRHTAIFPLKDQPGAASGG
jgi:two-component system sensor histidine kinase UhpB